MENETQVTQLIERLKTGNEDAAAQIWEKYFHRVRALAEKKLGSHPRRDQDADDLALSAINALYMGAREGRFQKLENRDDLWQLMAMIASRKAANSWRKQGRRNEVGQSILSMPNSDDGGDGLGQVAGDESTEQTLDSLSDTCQDLLSLLDDRLQEVALLRLAGHSNEEIADKMNRSVKSVERYMKMIRERWAGKTDQPIE